MDGFIPDWTAIDWRLVNYISLPIVAALIGWFTNFVAVKMLFRPQRPVHFLGLKIQGLVPRRQKDLAVKIASTIHDNLISHRDVQAVLQTPETQRQIEQLIEAQIDLFLREKLNMIPMVGALLQGELLKQIRGMLVTQFKSSIPGFMDGLMGQVESKLDFQRIVREKVESFDLGQLERIVYDISSRELRTIELLGGLLGFFVGLAQLGLLLLTSQ